MGNVISEGLEYIGRIDDDGAICDAGGNRIAVIHDDGFIFSEGGKHLGKIMSDGTICDSMSNKVGQILENGYVYIHSKRVCKVSSSFIERLTPDAYNYGESGTRKQHQAVKSRAEYNVEQSSEESHFPFGFVTKLVAGIALGIFAMVQGWGGIEMIVAGPIVVFLLCFFAKIFEHSYD